VSENEKERVRESVRKREGVCGCEIERDSGIVRE